MNSTLRDRLLSTASALALGAVGATAAYYSAQKPSDAVVLAREIGAYYESSGRHIGTPYVDKIGKGHPLTVCNGVTGPDVKAGKKYSPDECKAMELRKYAEAEKFAKRTFVNWGAYNVWVQASILDMLYNTGPAALNGSTLVRLANSGDLVGACEQMPRWVYGTVNGRKTRLAGLAERRDTTRELCAEWGRDGHFSAGILEKSR